MAETIKITVVRIEEIRDGYAGKHVPLLQMDTEFPDLAAVNLRLLADRIELGSIAEHRKQSPNDPGNQYD